VNIRDLMTDPALFGGQFGGDSFKAWRALLAGFFGLELTEEETSILKELTGRDSFPLDEFIELILVIGRRGGKSNVTALIAVYLACFFDYTDRLAPGEIGTVLCLAADKKQARAVFRYVCGLLH